MDKPKFLPGDVVFVMHHDNWISKVIAWFMRSKWSHSAIVIDVGHNYTFLLETTDLQVAMGTLDTYIEKDSTSVEVLRMQNVDLYEIVNALSVSSKINYGTLYGFLQLFGFAIKTLGKRVGLNIPNFIRQGIVCSGVVSYTLKLLNLDIFKDSDPENIDTEELYQNLKKLNFITVYSKEASKK